MFPHSSDNSDGMPLYAKLLGFAPKLVLKLQGVFMTMQNPESLDKVIDVARKRGYFEDGGEMFLLLAHRFQSMTQEHTSQTTTLALDALTDDTLRILGTNRAEIEMWMRAGVMRLLRECLTYARDAASQPGEERISGQPRGFMEEDESTFLHEIISLGYPGVTLETIDEKILTELGTSHTELLFLRKIGKIHRAVWLIAQAREDGYLLSDNWEGLMTYLADAQGTSDNLRLESITDDTLTLADLSRSEVQSWFRHVPE